MRPVPAAEETAELRRELEALRASNRDLEEFAAVAAHDLQEPLRKIRIFADRLAAEDLTPQGVDYLQRMQRSASRMQTLVDDLLTLSRVSGPPRLEPIDLAEIASDVVADLDTAIELAHATVEVDPLPVVEADPLQMRQLLQNLLSNALKFRRPEVPAVVHVYAEGDGRLVVEDNGIGFDPRHAERIFAPFERLNPQGEYEGSGVGLAVCRRIAERHGGTIEASSAPGGGARFVVTLPPVES